tara:strand:- start:5657 stop:6274 length:618 start_codon:yes stop_codon:yes gene_type:complete
MTQSLHDSITNQITKEKYNKLRMIQINTYYGKRYQAHIQVVKMILLYIVPLILITILAKKNIFPFIPIIIYKFIGFFIILFGLYFVIIKIYDLSLRDNMDYDKYKWTWQYDNEDNRNINNNINLNNKCGPTNLKDQAIKNLNEEKLCSNNACCDVGTKYDRNKNRCVGLGEGFDNKMVSRTSCSPWDSKGGISAYDNNSFNYSSV